MVTWCWEYGVGYEGRGPQPGTSLGGARIVEWQLSVTWFVAEASHSFGLVPGGRVSGDCIYFFFINLETFWRLFPE